MADPFRRVHAVLLAGGKGTRFWPRSRARRPKQLLPIVGERSMLADTLDRVSSFVPPERVWAVTAADHAAEVAAELEGVPDEQVLVEPIGRNTAPAIGLAALRVVERDPGAILVVLPADHHVRSPQRFRAALARAVRAAEKSDVLVTLGIEPTEPETGYGYIERGAAMGAGIFRVRRFVEKPDRARARRLLASGRFLWNAGIFAWRASAILAALAEHLPALDRGLRRFASARADDPATARTYARLPSVSIDSGVLEKAKNIAVVPASFGWDDVGSWSSLERLWPSDREGNAVRGRVVVLDGSRNLVAAERRVVALVGVEDLVVVDSEDAILVCHRDRTQDVKRALEEIERRGWREYL